MTQRESPSVRIRIVVVDDHAVVRAGLRSLLQKQHDMTVVGEAGSAAELAAIARELAPDVIVTDLRMPGGGVLDAIRRARSGRPDLGIIVFSAFDDPREAVQALEAGASGYVLKQAPEDQLLTAIRCARAGRLFVDGPVAARIRAEGLDDRSEERLARAALLSEREAAVLQLVARGYTGPQIAAELGVQLGTVESYRHRLRAKLGLRSRAEVTEFARAASRRLRKRP